MSSVDAMTFPLSLQEHSQAASGTFIAIPPRELAAAHVRAYMALQMGMSTPLDDQEQNWIYGHMTEFAVAFECELRQGGKL